MFLWDKTINRIDISSHKVLHLFKSMRDVQMALPGIPAQQATAYLCQYQEADGIVTVAVFHLKKKNILAFYFSDPRLEPASTSGRMLEKGLNFVESMGFLLTDQDIQLLNETAQRALWASLPLKTGVVTTPEPLPEAPLISKNQSQLDTVISANSSSVIASQTTPFSQADDSSQKTKTQTDNIEDFVIEDIAIVEEERGENINDLLKVVQSMRAQRPGLIDRKAPVSLEDSKKRKKQLTKTLGRILSSL